MEVIKKEIGDCCGGCVNITVKTKNAEEVIKVNYWVLEACGLNLKKAEKMTNEEMTAYLPDILIAMAK